MKEFNYEIKIENSPLNVGINLNGLKVKSMELQKLMILMFHLKMILQIICCMIG